MKNKLLLILIVLSSGCAAIPLNPGAGRVRVVKAEPGKECRFLGEATGHQGGGGYVSEVNKETGARNDLKNKAAEMGGNTVTILTDRSHTNAFGKQMSVTLSGSVYQCPE
ncbi:MAG: DUF4156 domain-containing protein [Elusimicrobiales bacterium]